MFNNVEACKELAFIRKYFVLCPVDKATKNVAIICKQYYLSDILQECQSNEGILMMLVGNMRFVILTEIFSSSWKTLG